MSSFPFPAHRQLRLTNPVFLTGTPVAAVLGRPAPVRSWGLGESGLLYGDAFTGTTGN
jgi:hypothetical protein